MTKNQKEKIPVQVLLTPQYILTTGKILTAVSPFLASRFAARLFLTPRKYKLPDREKKMDSESYQRNILLPDSQQEIVLYSYGNQNAEKKVLLVHGWSGRGTQLSVIAEELNEKYHILTFDAPGHGKAPGKMSMMPYFIEAVKVIEKEYGRFDAAIGHSLGGMSLLKAVREGLQLQKLVIIGTANSVTHITRDFAANMKLNPEVAAKMKSYLDGKFGQDMDNYSGAASAKEVSIPTLVIHDKNDVDVHVSSAYEIHAQLQSGELYITEGLGHRKILGDQEVINKIKTFIAV